MPPINDFKCSKCGFSLESGWGGYMYVEDNSGKRIMCPHPGEMWIVSKLLGEDASPEMIKARTGFNSYCICLDCIEQFELDLGDEEETEDSWRYYYNATTRKDKRVCPHCNSESVKTVIELIDNPCPRCKEGIIEEIDTGIIC